MTRKLILGLSVTVLAVFSVSAQYTPLNARISSMGDIYTIEDIGDVYRYAANMGKYKDDIQVTFSSPMLGIKSLGEMVTLGAYIRQGLVLDNEFYRLGIGHVNSSGSSPNLTPFGYMPHALIGVKAGPVMLGFDVFLEWARSRYHSESTANAVTTTNDGSKRVSNVGLIASALIDVNTFPITLKLGFSKPDVKGVNETEIGTTTTKIEYISDKGAYLELGGEIGIPLKIAQLTAGVDYNYEGYAFKIDTVDPANSYSINRLAIFGSLQNKAFTNGLWALQYQFKLRSFKNDFDAEAQSDLTNTTIEHVVSAGAENGWDNVWIFDKAFARGGVSLNLSTPYAKSESDSSEASSKSQKLVSAEPTVGFGVNKGPFELDLRINLTPGAGGWSNLFTGPGVAIVTGTLRF